MDVLRRPFFVFCVISVPEADYANGLCFLRLST